MSQPMDYFERFFIINFVARTDRRDEIAAQLKAIGLSLAATHVELFPAVRPEAADGFPSFGAKGCVMSHLNVLREAQRLGLQRVLIFEDGLDFAKDFNSRIKPFIEQLPRADGSLFYGGYHMQPLACGQVLNGLVEARPDELVGTTHFIAFQGAAIAASVAYLEKTLTRPAGDPDGGPMHVNGVYSWLGEQVRSLKRCWPVLNLVFSAPRVRTFMTCAGMTQRPWFVKVWHAFDGPKIFCCSAELTS